MAVYTTLQTNLRIAPLLFYGVGLKSLACMNTNPGLILIGSQKIYWAETLIKC